MAEVATGQIDLYHFERCPYCEKTRRTFRALHLNYNSHVVNPEDRSQVKEVSGQTKVPVIVEGETVVNDSSDIYEYMHTYHSNGVHLVPERDQDKGLAKILDEYADKVWGPLYYQALKQIDDNGNDLDDAGKKTLQRNIDQEAGILNQMLRGRNYIIGVSLAMADLSISAFINRLIEMTDFKIQDSYRHLWEWYEQVEAQLET